MLEAGREALGRREDLLQSDQSFAVETTLTGRREIFFMSRAAELGRKVNLVFIGLDNASLSSARVTTRIAAGGHPVDPADILRRFDRSMSNLPRAMEVAERTLIADNSGQRARLLMMTRTAHASSRAICHDG